MKKFRHRITISVTVIAVLAIVWNLLQATDNLKYWWSMPLVAGITGILAIIIPFVGKRVPTLYSVNATGIALLLLTIANQLIPSIRLTFPIIFFTALAVELLLNSEFVHMGTIVLDAAISFVATFIINMFSNQFIVVGVLLIAYILVIFFDFDYKFSVKKIVKNKKEPKHDDSTTQNADINIVK